MATKTPQHAEAAVQLAALRVTLGQGLDADFENPANLLATLRWAMKRRAELPPGLASKIDKAIADLAATAPPGLR